MVLVTGFHVTECHPAIDSPGSPAVYILGPVSPAPVMGSTSVVLEKTLERPWDCKEFQPVHPKGDQPWVFMARTDAEAKTPMLWPPHAKS